MQANLIKCISFSASCLLAQKNSKKKHFISAALQELNKMGYKLVVSSNKEENTVEEFMKLGIFHFFQSFFWAPKVGFYKPQVKFFEEISTRLEIESSRILHVGSSFFNDYEASKKAGWQSILLLEKEAYSNCKGCVANMDELLSFIKKSRHAGFVFFKKDTHALLADFKGLPVVVSRGLLRKTKPFSALVNGFLQKNELEEPRVEQVILQNWENVMGESLARRCHLQRVVQGKKLVLLIESHTLRQEICFQKSKILSKIQALPGCKKITELLIHGV